MVQFEVKDLSFAYSGSNFKALSHINLTIYEGSFNLIIGKSGSGKSTLLRHFKPQLTPFGASFGEVLYNNNNILQLSQRDSACQIGFVMQNPSSQIVCDKVYAELALGLECIGESPQKIRTRLAETTAFFALDKIFYSDTATLSGGEKQRLVLASILAMRPKVLILDEPTAHLDPVAAADLFSLLYKINQDFGTTIIVSEQRTEEVFTLCDNVIFLKNGKIFAQGKPQDVFDSSSNNKANDYDELMFPAAVRLAMTLKPHTSYPISVNEGRKYLKNLVNSNSKNQIIIKKNNSNQLKKNIENDYVLESKNLYFAYQKTEREILRGVSLRLNKGFINCILGANASGKTTLISCLGGAKKPFSGSIKILGKIISDYKGKSLYKNTLAVLPQNSSILFLHKTVRDELHSMQGDEDETKHIISYFKLDDLLEKNPLDLSAGEAKRVALAMVLLLKPQILLLDEPTAGVDAYFKKQLSDMLKKLAQSGISILMTTHDVEFAATTADMFSILFDGELSQLKNANEFFEDNYYYTTQSAKIGKAILINSITVDDLIQKVQELLGK